MKNLQGDLLAIKFNVICIEEGREKTKVEPLFILFKVE